MKLTVRSDPLDRILFVAEWKEGHATLVECRDSIINDTSRWFTFGLSEWIRREIPVNAKHGDMSKYGSRPRMTYPHEATFLPRIKEYIERSYKFTCILTED